MHAVILIGIQGSGKSTFVRERLYDTHVRLNLDTLRTRRREAILLRACLEARQPFVVDNTNASREERSRFIAPAKAAGFEITGYYFRSAYDECAARNALRPGAARVPDAALRGTLGRLERPTVDEGFDRLRYVRIDPGAGFVVEEWLEEPPEGPADHGQPSR